MTSAAAMLLFNHFFVTPSRATFDAVAAARPLGAWEQRTTVRKDAKYTGLYLYGTNTYFELLDPASDLGAPYGVAVSGKLGEQQLIYRGEAPWFLISPADAPIAYWGMEYVPEFFKQFHAELPPAQPGLSRADALTRYAASCGKLRERDEGLFGDVEAIHVELAPGAHWQPPQTDVQIRVTPGARTAITSAVFKLRRDGGKSEQKLGDTTLWLDGKRAVWRFSGE